MELKQIKGNTWALVAQEYIPIYRIDSKKCLVMDSGYPNEREKIEAAFAEHGLEPVGMLCSHAHVDHIGSSAYFHEKYQIPLYISQGEAGILSNILNAKAYRVTLSPNEIRKVMGDTICLDPVIVKEPSFQTKEGVEIGVVSTYGHSSDHLAFVTPDDVCYLGDALLTQDQMEAKLPYAFDIAQTLKTHEKIKNLPYSMYVMAHNGVCSREDLPSLVEKNKSLFLRRATEICYFAGSGKTIDQLTLTICQAYKLNTRKADRVLMFQRNIKHFLEFMVDSGEMVMDMSVNGVIWRPVSTDFSTPVDKSCG